MLIFADLANASDKGDWPGETVEAGSTITSRSAGRPHRGRYGFNVDTIANQEAYRYWSGAAEAIAEGGEFWLSFDLLISGKPSATYVRFARMSAPSNVFDIRIDSGGIFRLLATEDDGSQTEIACGSDISGSWHHIVLHWKRATSADSNDAQAEFWCDRTLVGSETALDTYTSRTGARTFSVGAAAFAKNDYDITIANLVLSVPVAAVGAAGRPPVERLGLDPITSYPNVAGFGQMGVPHRLKGFMYGLT